MKKIFLILALAATLQAANAQVKTVASAKAAVESAQKAADDEKKATKYATWLKLGQTLLDAYTAPMGAGWVGASEQELNLLMAGEKPVSEEQVVIGGQPMVKKVYDTRNYYFNQYGQLASIEVTQPIYADALERALDAFRKAAELDVKGAKAKDIQTGVGTIIAKYTDEAYNAYSFGDLAKASEFFEKAADASVALPGSTLDTDAVYNTGFTAYMGGNFSRAKEFLQKSIDAGFDGDQGDAYAKLADIADSEGNQAERKELLEKAFKKYPQSQSVLIGLINYYVQTGENTDALFGLLDEAKKNEPTNASLYNVEGNIYEKLGQPEKALASYDKCSEINPDYEYGYISKGIYYYNKAADIQEAAANEMDDARYAKLVEDFESSLKSCIEPFEKAFEVTKDDGIRASVAEYLKNACFRFRSTEEYAAKYEKYAAVSAN